MRWSTFTGFVVFAAVVVGGCSNGPATTDAGTDAGPTCDDTKCKPGNQCINDGKTLTCRIPCNSNEPSDPTACPANFHCVASLAADGSPKPNTNKAGETLNYCVKDNHEYKANPGTWGALCNPQKGFDMNPDCDTSQSFFCYGTSPTDADSYCTQFDCNDDNDCRMGWWCASINTTPNVTTGSRTFGPDQVRNVCLPRAWNMKPTSRSAPCKADLDCPLNEGNKQVCIDPGDGVHLMCAAVCKTNSNCTNDAACTDVGRTDKDGNPQLLCVPRAGTFGPLGAMEKGKGDFCSPCHADDDCIDGVCTIAEKSVERFCTKKSGVTCMLNGNTLVSDCPMPTAPSAPGGVSCTYSSSSADLAPRDQCFGLVLFGAGVRVPGCWTANRN